MMRQLKMCMFGVVSLCVLGVVFAASASATKCTQCLPDIHFLPGEKEATMEESAQGTGIVKWITESGTALEADELKVLASMKNLSALGLVDLHFVNVKPAVGTKKNAILKEILMASC